MIVLFLSLEKDCLRSNFRSELAKHIDQAQVFEDFQSKQIFALLNQILHFYPKSSFESSPQPLESNINRVLVLPPSIRAEYL